GGQCEVDVTFTPSTITNETATLNITNTSGSVTCTVAAPCSFNVQGQGLTPATATLTPNPLTFPGTTSVGQTSAAQIATLTNTTVPTATPLNITNAVLAGTNPGDFSIVNTCPSPLARGSSCSILVLFTPTTTGARSAMLTVTDDAVGGTQSITIMGNGVAPPAQVTLPAVNLQFAPQGLGTMSTAQTVTITNSATAGSQSLMVTQPLAFMGGNAGDFAATGCATAVLPGGNCVISVTFTPTATGARTSTLQVASNAGNGTQTVAVSGTGLAGPTATPSGAVTFSPQAVNSTSAPMNVSLTNSGGTALPITSIALTGGNAADFAILSNGCGTSLSPGATCFVSVTFTPPSIATFNTTLAFVDSVGTQNVAISGTGVQGGAGSLTLSAPLFFGAVLVGSTSPAQVVAMTNSGGSQITLTGISASGDFAETNACPAMLNPGSSCTVSVTFTPTANGTRTGMLTIAYNAPGSPQVVTLSGIGATISVSAVTGSNTSITVTPGDTATYMLSVSGTQGLIVTLNLTCASSAPFTLCSVSPASVTLGGPTAPTVTVTVQTNCNPSFVGGRPTGPVPLPPAPVAAFTGLALLLAMMLRLLPKPWAMRLAPALVLLLLVVTWTACVSNPPPAIPGAPTTPAGTFNITLTATSNGTGQNVSKQVMLVLRVI
ncbi:MAG TPA: choice-of-anchor D domain-containing protein, partial [Candidatus Acidoferrales bacterium]|nr:choice-of-anchor D domain-containing protein [Candidatus Acidoferrales bacterium]